ncbi:fimbrial biogenesis chaperone [Pandoraea commovens]|uniref:Fimbria/pilus periplasmic chaperone n=1 Tax=Pandoraea commovens TaxID=2508289 RepID=A0ABY5QLL0_9BURK|nr:fimbria/pilus periplasmic chaperone [Pandoraea commovens]UVA81028.1 fimbria/pilus periplasmic chaperone [Pandoraea commovens]
MTVFRLGAERRAMTGAAGFVRHIALRSPLLLVLAATLVSLPAAAATLQISPVNAEFAAKQNAIGMTLSNPGDTTVYGQVRIYTWTQADGEDKLTPTDAIAASPPILRIEPGSSQIIRLVRMANTPPATEQSFRLLVDELPEPGQPVQSGITIHMRYSIPVFVAPPTVPAKPDLRFKLKTIDGVWHLEAENHGGTRAQIGASGLVDAAGKSHPLTSGLLGYALAGQRRVFKVSWPVGKPPASPLALDAAINTVPTRFVVNIDGGG